MMNKYEKTFEEFLETTTHEPIKNNTRDTYMYPIRNARNTLKALKNTDSVTWDFIYNEIHSNYKASKKLHATNLILWVLYAIKLDEKGYLKGSLNGQLVQNAEAISSYIFNPKSNKIDVFESENFNPFSIILAPIKIKTKNRGNHVFVIKNITMQQHKFILQYINSIPDKSLDSKLKQGLPRFFNLLVCNNCLYTDFESYNDEKFFQQFKIIKTTTQKEYSNPHFQHKAFVELIYFFRWIQSNMEKNIRKKCFTKITPEVLKNQYLINLLLNGYEIVNYSIYEEPPKSDKWILQGQQMSMHQTAKADKLTQFDVSKLKNKHLKQWVKECYWFDTSHSLGKRNTMYNIIFDFLGPIDARIDDYELPQITKEDILSFKALCASKDVTDTNIAYKLGAIKFFLNFIEDKGYIVIEELIYRLLSYHDSRNNSYKETYTKEEIKQLLAAYKDSYNNCKDEDRQRLYILYYYIIAIQSLSEMRVSTILNLKTDCLVKTLERNGQDEYKVVVYSKTSGREPDEYNITHYVKSLIDEVIGLTADLRNKANGIANDYIFIYRRNSRKSIAIVRQDALSKYHKDICAKYGIRQLNLGTIRNYYQQQVSEYVAKKGDDPMLIERLSKHGINVHIQHYDTVNITDFCELLHEVEIGSIELKGDVQGTNDKPAEATVAKGCGHCSQPTCALAGNLDCLMCSNFVATLDCIPQFEKEIEWINEQILNEPLQHEKEFLINKKRLNVAYLAKLCKLEVEVNANKTCV